MAGLLETLREDGARELIAVIGDSDNYGSIQLHKRAGFAHVGIMKNVGQKFGRWLDVVIMQRSLRPPQTE
jgi:phosphinothricin acetyltransferase